MNLKSHDPHCSCPDCMADHMAAEIPETASPQHTRDEDCDIDPATDCCRTCGVDHGGECLTCEGRGFHKLGCPDSDATIDAQRADPSLDVLCCGYKSCGHTCEESDPCVACVGRGDCGEGHQMVPGEGVARG